MPLDLQPVEELDLQPVELTPEDIARAEHAFSIWPRIPDKPPITDPLQPGQYPPGSPLAMMEKQVQKIYGPLVEVTKHMPSAREVSDALDVLAAFAPEPEPMGTPNLSPELREEMLTSPSAPGTASKVTAGTLRTLGSVPEFLTTPHGAATLGMGGAPALAQRAVAGTFTVDLARHLPDQAKAVAEAIKEGDPEKIAETTTGLALTSAFLAGTARHTFRRTPPGQAAGERMLKSAEETVLDLQPVEAAAIRGGTPLRQVTSRPEAPPLLDLKPVGRASPELRFQWMRNKEGGQSFGNQQVIRSITESDFQKFIRPRLQQGYADTLVEYQARNPEHTHIGLFKRAGDKEWQFEGVNSVEALVPRPENPAWVKQVDSFDSAEARTQGQTADSPRATPLLREPTAISSAKPPAAETITGPPKADEGVASEMPAEREKRPKPVATETKIQTPEEKFIAERQTPRPETPQRAEMDAQLDADIEAAQAAYKKMVDLQDAYNAAKYGSKKKEQLYAKLDQARDAYTAVKEKGDAARERYQTIHLEDLAESDVPIASEWAAAEAQARRYLSPEYQRMTAGMGGRYSPQQRATSLRNAAWETVNRQVEEAFLAEGLTPGEAKAEAMTTVSMATSYPLAEFPKLVERVKRISQLVKERRGGEAIEAEFRAIESPVKGTQYDRFRSRIEDQHSTAAEKRKALDDFKTWHEKNLAQIANEQAARDRVEREQVESRTEAMTKEPTTKFAISDYGAEVLSPGRFVSNGKLMADGELIRPSELKKLRERPMRGTQGLAQGTAEGQVWNKAVASAKAPVERIGYGMSKAGDELVYYIDPKTRQYWAIQRSFEGLIDRWWKGGAKAVKADAKQRDKPGPLVFYHGEKPIAVVMPFSRGVHADIDVAKAIEQLKPKGTSGTGHPIPALPPIPGPAVPGTHRYGTLPVAMERMVPGQVDVPTVMASMEKVMKVIGSEVPIRTGRFYQNALGIYKGFVETIRLRAADDIPTAAHEVAHAMSDVVFGSTKSRPLMAAVQSRPAIAELRALGKALYGSRKPNAGYTAEGFSELVRLWLTTEDAARRAPQATRWFEDTLLPSWPEMATALRETRDLIDVWRGQGAKGRAEAQMKSPGRLEHVKKVASDILSYEAQIEQFAPLEELSTGFAKQTGRRLPVSQDPFLIATSKRGSAGAVLDTWVERNMTDVWGNSTGPGLREALARIKPGEAKDFAFYLWARRAIERWGKNKNPGMALEDAQHLRATLETPAFIDAAQKFYQWWDGALEYVKQASPAMNGALVDAIRTGSSDYVPLARMLDPTRTKGSSAGHGGGGLYKMHGSGLPIRNLYEQSLLVAERLIGRAHRDMVLDAVFKLSRHEGMGWLVEKVPRTRVVEQVNVEKIRRELENYGVDTTAIPEDTLISYATHLDKPSGTDPIMVRQTAAGPEWYQVPARVYDLLQGLDPARLGPVADLFVGVPNRAFKMGTTGLRASFSLVTNPARDLPTFMMQSIYGNPASRAAAYMASLSDIVQAGLGLKVSPEWEAFQRLGIGGGMFLGGDIQHAKREARSLFRGKMFRRVASPVESLRELLSFTEAVPRLAELRMAGKELGWTPGQPMTPEQAIAMSVAAKRITTDFSAAGSEGRMWNQAMPFYNATVQGTRAFLRAFKRDQGIKDVPHRALFTVLKGTALLTVPALANWWANKDEDWYRDLPWRERYLYTNVDDGAGGVVQVPRPPEWGQVFMVLPEALFDAWYVAEKEQDPERAKAVVGAALSHFLATQNPLSLPTTLETARQQWENRIAFFDRPIVPRNQQDLPAGEQRAYFSSKLATALGDAFPNTVSPRRVDAAIRSLAGGLGGDVAQFPTDLMRALGLEESPRGTEPADMPVIGRLFRRGGQFSANNQALADFWDAASRLDAHAQAGRVRVQAGAEPTEQQMQAMSTAALVDVYRLIVKTELEIAASTVDPAARQKLYRSASQTAHEALKTFKAESMQTR